MNIASCNVYEEQYLERLRSEVAVYEAIKNNGKSAEQNCKETGICVHAFRDPNMGKRDWLFVARCVECGVFNSEYNPAY